MSCTDMGVARPRLVQIFNLLDIVVEVSEYALTSPQKVLIDN